MANVTFSTDIGHIHIMYRKMLAALSCKLAIAHFRSVRQTRESRLNGS